MYLRKRDYARKQDLYRLRKLLPRLRVCRCFCVSGIRGELRKIAWRWEKARWGLQNS